MMEAIEQADGYSCDVWVKETVNLESSGNYGNMAGTNRVIFPLAKLQDPKHAGTSDFCPDGKRLYCLWNKLTSSGGSRISQIGLGGGIPGGAPIYYLEKALSKTA